MSIRDYKITDAQFSEKGVIAAPDTLTGTAAENKGVFDRFAREIIAPQFNAIVDDFADMEESTNSWSAEEAQRVQQENARQSAEQGRVSAEGQRVQSEKTRLSAESRRVADENARSAAETARVNAENKRDSAEKSRVSAENARNVWQTYDAAKTYVPGNKVSFGGSSYLCTAATVGHEPTDTAYWLLIAQKGADGAGADDLRRINDALDAIDPTKVSAKAAPADGDGVMIADSADGSKAKRLLWSSVKEALGKLFVPLTRKVNGKVLTEDVTLTGENIAVSTADSTPISGAVKYRTNPNLLDNWYFGRPVNQRNGYYIPAGVKYNTLSWTEAGTTDKAYPVIGYIGQDPLITVNGTNYIVGKSLQVPGYCTTGYTVDRWKFNNNNGDIVIDDTGIMFTAKHQYAEFEQQYEFPKNISGKQITMSILADSFSGEGDFYLVIQNQTEYRNFHLSVGLNSFTIKFFDKSSVLRFFIQSQNVNETNPPKMHFLAAKLELGDTQTLAHKENEKWVLNEIPDFGEQLRRCQRFYRRWTGADNKQLGVAVRRESKLLELVFSLDTTMRVAPSLTFNGSFVCVPAFTWCSVTSIDVATPDTVAVFLKPNDDVTFDLDAYQINIALANEYIALSADL